MNWETVRLFASTDKQVMEHYGMTSLRITFYDQQFRPIQSHDLETIGWPVEDRDDRKSFCIEERILGENKHALRIRIFLTADGVRNVEVYSSDANSTIAQMWLRLAKAEHPNVLIALR